MNFKKSLVKKKLNVDCYFTLDKPKLSKKEDLEAIDFNSDARYNHGYIGSSLFHVSNETKANPQYMRKRKNMGVISGVSDYVLLVGGSGYNFLCIELKRECGVLSNISDEQLEFLNNCNNNGGYGCVCFGASQALIVLEMYLTGKLN